MKNKQLKNILKRRKTKVFMQSMNDLIGYVFKMHPERTIVTDRDFVFTTCLN